MRHHLLTRVVLQTFLILLLAAPSPIQAEILSTGLVKNGGYIISRNGTILEQYRQKELFQTASTIKLLTALAVIDTLGKDYHFTTSFYIDSSNVLYVRGSGDPFLTSEYLGQIGDELKREGIGKINGYVLDDSLFQLEHPLPDGSENSHNPYDAPNGGLAVNFNSISVIKNKSGSAGTGESQTPTLPVTLEIAEHLQPGRHRINISHFPLAGSIPPQLRYTAELLHALLKGRGIDSTLAMRLGPVPPTARKIYDFTSPKNVEELLASCLHYSNNFIANQLVLTAGAARYGTPATWAKAQSLLSDYVENRLRIPKDQFNIVEGSGLSRKNRMSPEAMLVLLDKFQPLRHLLPGKNGALLKSGTMKSVYCYAGYLEKKESHTSFVFMLNQKENTRNRLLNELKRNLPKS